jgi:hypothetical protein
MPEKAGLGDLVVSVLDPGSSGLSVAGSGAAKGGGFLWDKSHVKEPYRPWVNALSAKFPEPCVSPVIFLLRYQMAVLKWQTSHLLFIRTNLGYGTVIMAACARQGRSATDYYYY